MINCVYIHIPFCEKKCNYCAFCSFNLLKYKDIYIDALLNEVKFLYKNEKLKTIYFGGGTPSLLNVEDIERILANFKYDDNTEITLEANPTNLTFEKLKDLKRTGINRLSLGVQCFDDKILKIIGRNHNSKDIYNAVENINNAGFNNFSMDLIYGLPHQDLSRWEETLQKTLLINPSHISLYGLKIEKGTYFDKFPPKNIADEELQAVMYEKAVEILKEKYLHYEFSNFAADKNLISRHNCAYWKCENYYGFGLSASGYIGSKRYTNTFNFREYLNNPLDKDYQMLSQKELIEEEVFLGFRLTEGINFHHINEKFNIDIYEKFKSKFDKYLNNNLMQKTENGAKLTTKGILLSNEILCDFIEIN